MKNVPVFLTKRTAYYLQFLAILLLPFSFMAFAQHHLVHNPNLSPKGDLLAFVYQGDIWTANIDGSNPKRITIHEGYDSNPFFTHDGSKIVFQSDRFGSNDIFVIPYNGGLPKRLTYASASDVLTDVTSQNKVLFGSKRDFAQVESEPEIFEVALEGGTPKRLLNSLGFDATLSPDGRLLAFTRGSCRIAREAYRGSANRDVWVYNLETDSYHQITTFQGNDFSPIWGNDNKLFFQSSMTGKYNVHMARISEEGGLLDMEPITEFTDFGIFSFQLGNGGKTIILSQMDKLFLVDVDSKESSLVQLELNSDFRFDPVVTKTYTEGIQQVIPSPSGRYSILTVRGELFLTRNDKEETRTVNLTQSPYKDANAFWLNEETIIFTSDRNGVQNFYKITSSDAQQKDLFHSLKHKIEQLSFFESEVGNPVLSPDKKSLAYTLGRGSLYVSKISENGQLSEAVTLNNNGWSLPSGIAWSPDNKWLAYSLKDLEFNSDIFIQKVDGRSSATNISMHPKADINPIWSDDGSKIGFTSNRNNSDYDVWFVWLQKKDWERTPEDWKELAALEADKKAVSAKNDSKKENENKEVTPITIDLDGIYERQVQVTRYSGGEFLQGISSDGKTFYYTTGNGTRTNIKNYADLYKIQWDGEDKKALTQGDANPRSVTFGSKKEFLYYIRSGKPYRINLKKDAIERIAFSATMDIHYEEEGNQIFEDAWRAINDGFYNPQFNGQDWDLLKAQYKPLALKASTRADFQFVFNWMLGQINASHMGMRGGENRTSLQRQSSGQLGVDITPLKDGSVEVVSTTVTMPAQKQLSTLYVGDIITGVNGKKLTPTTNFYSLLNNTVNEKIYLNVKNSKGASREVVIRPVSSNRRANYKAWVKERRRLTEAYSEGRLGYIHIQGMNWTSFEEFERELTAAGQGKEGIVIDVRYNGGGWTTDYLMAVLTVRQHAYTVPRGATDNLGKDHGKFVDSYPYSERLPLAAWTKPSIALCNERSYSNAEIFSHAYKALNIGTLVGQPTFGAVISTGSHRLIDGSSVRMPYRGWYIKDSGLDMELQPAVPDILVKSTPDERAKKQDAQLRTAVMELLRQIEEKK